MSWEGMTIMIISMCYEAFEVMKESLNAITQHAFPLPCFSLLCLKK